MIYGGERRAPGLEIPGLEIPGLEIRGLAKSFVLEGRPHPVFSGIDLTIERGAFVAIVGESGSGKTTLLRIIAGLEAADAGSVTLGGREVHGVGSERGMVFQEPRLLSWLTVRRNVSLGLELRGLPRPVIDRTTGEFSTLSVSENLRWPIPANCRVAWRSGSALPAHWQPTRKSCFSMSPWAP
jgi:ABC-type sugar transport system ATPase subunit